MGRSVKGKCQMAVGIPPTNCALKATRVLVWADEQYRLKLCQKHYEDCVMRQRQLRASEARKARAAANMRKP